MASRAELSVHCIAPELLRDGTMWRVVGGLLLRGQMDINATFYDAVHMLAHYADCAQKGTMQVWAVFEGPASGPPTSVVAALFTQVVEERGRRLVWASGMAGERIAEWGPLLSERMAEFAAAEGCVAVAFAGRKALARVYPGARVVGDRDDDVALFERAVA